MQLEPGLNKCLNLQILHLWWWPGIGPAVARLQLGWLPWLSWPRTFLWLSHSRPVTRASSCYRWGRDFWFHESLTTTKLESWKQWTKGSMVLGTLAISHPLAHPTITQHGRAPIFEIAKKWLHVGIFPLRPQVEGVPWLPLWSNPYVNEPDLISPCFHLSDVHEASKLQLKAQGHPLADGQQNQKSNRTKDCLKKNMENIVDAYSLHAFDCIW